MSLLAKSLRCLLHIWTVWPPPSWPQNHHIDVPSLSFHFSMTVLGFPCIRNPCKDRLSHDASLSYLWVFPQRPWTKEVGGGGYPSNSGVMDLVSPRTQPWSLRFCGITSQGRLHIKRPTLHLRAPCWVVVAWSDGSGASGVSVCPRWEGPQPAFFPLCCMGQIKQCTWE